MKNAKLKGSITEGPIFSKLFFFTVPIILSGLLQVAYNMADNIVVGRFSGDELALAAVGSTASLTTLIVNFLMGFATGSGVVIAQAFGAGDKGRTSRSIYTAIGLSFVGGVIFAVAALALSSPLLTLMKTKSDVFDKALLYFRIICVGIPASTVYNFGSASLRALGNSKTPLYILSLSGLLNVILNLFFVIVCGMSVDGVATATVVSQYLSAVAVLLILFKSSVGEINLDYRKIKIEAGIFASITKIGLPAGIQSALFSIANIFLTSATNTLSTLEVSAKTIAFNIDGLVYTAMDGYLHSSMTFVGQNYGARKIERIKKSILYAIIQVATVGIVLGQLITLFCPEIVSLYINPSDPNFEAVSSYAVELSRFILSVYFMCGIMNTLSGSLRGLGRSVIPMVIGIFSSCVIRLIWIYGFFFPFEKFHSLVGLFYCYPISWIFAILALVISLLAVWKPVKRKLAEATYE
ncbi:MAG: MATE family efflux transporter [Clostridia bacterium]|nr:MATE family efflux transporter [Clostridia bacterium]